MTSTHFVWIGFLALLVFWAIGAYNRLVRLKNMIANAFGQVDVHLKHRYELIPLLVDAAKTYMSHEDATLEAVTLARNHARHASDAVRSRPSSAKAVTRLSVTEAALNGALGRLRVLAESYPELQADATIKGLAKALTSTDNKMAFARQAYNDAVHGYNLAQGEFPAVVLARLFGFGPSVMLQVMPNAEQRQALRIQLQK